MIIKDKEQRFFMDVAKRTAELSTGIRLKVGSVVLDSTNNIVATAYNGNIRGGSNELEFREYSKHDFVNEEYNLYDHLKESSYKLITKPSVIHAECNLIAHAARRGISINGGSVFITHSPCAHCTAMLIQTGIKNVYFDKHFRTYVDVINEFNSYISFIQVGQ